MPFEEFIISRLNYNYRVAFFKQQKEINRIAREKGLISEKVYFQKEYNINFHMRGFNHNGLLCYNSISKKSEFLPFASGWDLKPEKLDHYLMYPPIQPYLLWEICKAHQQKDFLTRDKVLALFQKEHSSRERVLFEVRRDITTSTWKTEVPQSILKHMEKVPFYSDFYKNCFIRGTDLDELIYIYKKDNKFLNMSCHEHTSLYKILNTDEHQSVLWEHKRIQGSENYKFDDTDI